MLQNRLKELREEHGLTQDELAAAVGIGSKSISGYERIGNLPIESGLKFASFFDVSLDYLYCLSNFKQNFEKKLESESYAEIKMYKSLRAMNEVAGGFESIEVLNLSGNKLFGVVINVETVTGCVLQKGDTGIFEVDDFDNYKLSHKDIVICATEEDFLLCECICLNGRRIFVELKMDKTNSYSCIKNAKIMGRLVKVIKAV